MRVGSERISGEQKTDSSWLGSRRAKVGASVALVAILSGGCTINTGGSRPEASATAVTSSGTSTTGHTGGRTTPSRPLPNQRTTFTEHADNHLGVPAYSDNRGSALEHGEPARIPYGTAVQVECYQPNESGMTNINFFYKIAGGPWNGDSAPANTFDNGAGMGPNSVDLDPLVPRC